MTRLRSRTGSCRSRRWWPGKSSGGPGCSRATCRSRARSSALRELAVSGELFVALAASLYRVSTGFVLGTVAGVIVGLGAGIVPGIRHFFDPLVSFLYSIPKIAFLPVFLLLFGLGHASKIAIIAFSGFFPVFIASRHAVLSVNKLLVWTAQNMGTPQRKIFFRVIIPAAAPQLFSVFSASASPMRSWCCSRRS